MTTAPLRLMLVDEDPMFRLGLKIWLEQTAGYAVVAEASDAADTLATLASRAAGVPSPDAPPSGTDAWASPESSTAPPFDLIILDLGLGSGQPDNLPGLRLCGDIKARYPTLPLLALSTETDDRLAAVARQMGADGFGSRSMAVGDLHRLIQQLTTPRPRPSALRPPGQTSVLRERPPVPPPRLSPLVALRLGMRQSAVGQIEAVMAQIEAEQRRGRGSLLAEALLAGRYRELRAARWLVRQLLATPVLSAQGPPPGLRRIPQGQATPEPGRLAGSREGAGYGADSAPQALGVAPDRRLAFSQHDLATRVLERVFDKCQGLLVNTSGIPLETDILREDKKRELIYLVLRKFEDALDQLRQAQVPPGQLADKAPVVLRDIWEAAVTDFFGRYYTLQVDNAEQPVVPTLLAEAPVVQAAILDPIPLLPMLLGHLLYSEAMVVDGGVYDAAAPEALERSQELLEHLLIQLANGVMQPVLNNFADVELLKKTLYQRRMMTSRDIERFRNDLSWRYRWDNLVNEPRAIFESHYRLLLFTERGIQAQLVYASRREELDQLSGLQRAVTLAVEARDAVAPRFNAAVALVGSGIVYVLTNVIGRGIGLIGRGILRGVGGGWRDPRYRYRYRDQESDRQEF